jgi:Tol biopolymer transport system component
MMVYKVENRHILSFQRFLNGYDPMTTKNTPNKLPEEAFQQKRTYFLLALLYVLFSMIIIGCTSSNAINESISKAPTLPPAWTPTLSQFNKTATALSIIESTGTPDIFSNPDKTETSIRDECATSPDFTSGIKIAFSSYHEENGGLYILDTSKPDLQRLTNNVAYDNSPSWSPDGSIIAFLSDRTVYGRMDIYLLFLSTGKLERLTFNHFVTGEIAWAPDSKKIAYVSAPNGNSYITILYIESKVSIRVPSAREWNEDPIWSPDGRKLAFVASDAGAIELSDIFLVNRDGTNLVQLTSLGNVYPFLSNIWSPDGTQIVYAALRNGIYNIYTIDIESGRETRLTDYLAYDEYPTWSPDGELIAYQSGPVGSSNIYLMDKNGNHIRQLTDDLYFNQFPSWSSDGRFIAFITTGEDYKWTEIRVVDVNGCSIKRLTYEFSDNVQSFAWAP